LSFLLLDFLCFLCFFLRLDEPEDEEEDDVEVPRFLVTLIAGAGGAMDFCSAAAFPLSILTLS